MAQNILFNRKQSNGIAYCKAYIFFGCVRSDQEIISGKLKRVLPSRSALTTDKNVSEQLKLNLSNRYCMFKLTMFNRYCMFKLTLYNRYCMFKLTLYNRYCMLYEANTEVNISKSYQKFKKACREEL